MKTAVIIPAAGSGTRMGQPKQLILLCGKPILTHALSTFVYHTDIDEIILVAPDEVSETAINFISREENETNQLLKKIKTVTESGENRQESVYNGLSTVSSDIKYVLIHDGARPIVNKKIVSDIISLIKKGHCAISGIKSKDTVKITNETNIVINTPIRENTWLVQTPQGFPVEVIRNAHVKAKDDGFVGTDDAMLVERMGIPVMMVQGDYKNIKITTPDDLHVAEMFLRDIT